MAPSNKDESEQHLHIGRAEMEAFSARLDAWLREQPAADQVLMAILTQDLNPSAEQGARYTLPAFSPGWTQQQCEWKLRLLGSSAVETVAVTRDDPEAETKQELVAELDLSDVFQDAYSW